MARPLRIGQPNLTAGKTAHLHIFQLDADVDSNNDSGFSIPDDNQAEDLLEQDSSTGKLVWADTGDVDEDGIVDTQDYYIPGGHFVPMAVRLSSNVSAANPSAVDVTLTYDSSKLRVWKPGKDASVSRVASDIIASGVPFAAGSVGLYAGGSVVLFVEALLVRCLGDR